MTQYELHQCLVEYASGVWGDEDLTNGISVLRSTNFKNDGRLDLSKRTYRNIPVDVKKKKILKPKDILLEKSGGSPKQPVGRVCYFDDEEPHMCGNFIAFLRVDTNICLPRYLFWVLHNLYKRGSTLHLQKQTTGIRNLDYKRYLKQKITLPSLKEQQRIVEILDRAENIKRLRQQAIETTQRVAPALFYELFGNPVKNEKGWETTTIADVTANVQKSHPQEVFSNIFPYIDIGGIDNLVGNINEVKNLAVDEAPSRARQIVATNDVLVSTVRPYLKAFALVNKSNNGAICSTGFSVLRCNDTIHPQYLFAYVRLDVFVDAMMTKARGATYPAVGEKDVRSHKLLLPPMEQQLEFAERIEFLNRVDRCESQSATKIGRLSSALSAQLLAA